MQFSRPLRFTPAFGSEEALPACRFSALRPKAEALGYQPRPSDSCRGGV